MREPKRLAHRQAERNKARALKQWSREDGEDDAPSTSLALAAIADTPEFKSLLGSESLQMGS
jgi:hypothetical protein